MTSFLDQLEAIRPDGVDAFAVDLDPEWNCPLIPQGGIGAAVAIECMQRILDDPRQRLRSAQVVFAAPVASGPCSVSVVVLRRGRNVSQLQATVTSDGSSAGMTVLAVFGADRRGFEFVDVAMPTAPAPEDCMSWRDMEDHRPDRIRFPFWDQLEGRNAFGAPFQAPGPRPTSSHGTWFRYDVAPLLPDGSWHPLAVLAMCDTMPGAMFEKLGPDVEDWYGPSADFTVHPMGVARSEWLLAHSTARWAGDGYASLDITVWDPTEGLVAYATQVMYFTFPDFREPLQ